MGATSLPRITAQLLAARGLTQPDTPVICIVGQIGSDGTAIQGQLYEDVQRKTLSEIESLFGTASELTGRILRARQNIKGRVPIYVIAMTESGTGVAADLDIVVTGTATESGILEIKVIDAELYTIRVTVTTDDTAAVVAGNIKAAIDELLRFPATASILSATVTLTANDKGTITNKYVVTPVNSIAGITVVAGQFSGGANDPILTTIFDSAQATRFHSISWPWENDFTVLQSFLESRNTINNAFLQGVGFIGYDDTEANITAKLNGVTPLNSQNLVFMGNRVATTAKITTPPDWRVAEFISIEALRMTNNVPIADFVTVSSPLDILGGPALASLALYNTPLALTDIANTNDLFNDQEQQNLKADGYTIVGVNGSRTNMIMAEVVTTYKFNDLGDPDESFKYLNYVRTGYLALEIFFKTLKSDYSQFRLTTGNIIAGRAMTNKEQMSSNLDRVFQVLGSADFTLVPAGATAEKYFSANRSVTIDSASGSVSISGELPIITQIRDISVSFQLSFSVGG